MADSPERSSGLVPISALLALLGLSGFLLYDRPFVSTARTTEALPSNLRLDGRHRCATLGGSLPGSLLPPDLADLQHLGPRVRR